ncbi:MAG: methyltransferase family protein [Vicinamibacteria bacterium]
MTVLDGARSTPEALFDYLLAGTVASWAVASLSTPDGRLSPVRCAVAFVHLAAAFHFSVRSPALRSGSRSSILASAPSIVSAGIAFSIAAPVGHWPLGAQALFTLGAVITVLSFCALGRSFGILPALRPIATRGPYRLLRHPAYAGELLMVLACALSRPSALAAAVVVVSIPLASLRIRAEEALLDSDERYRTYRERVRFRLLPGLW